MLNLKKNQLPILLANMLFLLAYLFVFLQRRNYEFIMYVGIIVIFGALVLATNKRVNYPNYLLWGLSLWGFMHMSGGGIIVDSNILYKLILIPITDVIFRYDQLVHIIGFGVSTLLMYHLIKPLLKPAHKWASLSIVIVMAGLGVGALNEIIEFILTVLVPETNVGGYINTSLDLVADLIGALIALVIIRKKEK